MKIITAFLIVVICFVEIISAQQHTFTNVTTQMGISGQTGLGHAVGWCDIENDGNLDLALSNQYGSGFWLYRNDKTTFTNITASTGLSGQGAYKILWAEVTNNTYTDLILNGTLYENNGDGTFSTYNAVGAKAIAWSNGAGITRWVHGGEGKHDFSSFNLEFGLGDKTMVDSLTICWPSGIVDKMYNLEANQFLTITEGSSPLTLTMSPDASICYGDSVQIYGLVSGGSGNYNFLWSPSTGLSNPTISNPIAFPEITTTYTLTVDDGNNSISDSTTITVFSDLYPEITATPNDTVSIYESIELNAGFGYLIYQWQDGSNSPFYIATNTSGPNGGEQVYWVEVWGEGGCTGYDTISVWFLPFTEINENKPDISFEVYPNPADRKVFIEITGMKDEINIILSSTYGRIIYKELIKQTSGTLRQTLDISTLPKGVYFIELVSKQGLVIKSHKLIK